MEKHKRELEVLKSIKEEIEFCKNNVFQFRPQANNTFWASLIKQILGMLYAQVQKSNTFYH